MRISGDVLALGAVGLLVAGSAIRQRRQGSSARARRQGRAEKAARRLGEVIGRGAIVHLKGAHYTGTVGPHKTATGPQRFALFVDGRRGRSEGGPWEYDSPHHAAEHAVEKFGVGNVIDGLKATAKRHGGQYTNLDTPIFRGGSRSATGQRLIKKLGNVKVYYRPDLDEYAVVPGDQKPWGSRDSKVYYTPDKDDAIETAVGLYDRR